MQPQLYKEQRKPSVKYKLNSKNNTFHKKEKAMKASQAKKELYVCLKKK